MATRENALKEGMNIQGALKDIGAERVPDLSAAEITAQQGMIDSLNALFTEEGKIDATFGSATVLTRGDWLTLWNLCIDVQDIALGKPGNEEGKAAMKKLPAAGGFNVSRARNRVRQVLGALTLYPDDFTAKGNTKAEIVTALQVSVDADQLVADKNSAVKGIESRIRNAVKALDEENDRMLTLLQATFDRGSPERDVVDRARVKRHATQKRITEQPEENK